MPKGPPGSGGPFEETVLELAAAATLPYLTRIRRVPLKAIA